MPSVLRLCYECSKRSEKWVNFLQRRGWHREQNALICAPWLSPAKAG